jgi:integrase
MPRRGRYTKQGVARALVPIKHKRYVDKQRHETGRWVARYVAADGRVAQVGIYDTKRAAANAISTAVDDENAGRTVANAGVGGLSLLHHLNHWPGARDMYPSTLDTHQQRVRRLCRHLDSGGDQPVVSLTVGQMAQARDRMQDERLGVKTINDAFESTSILLRKLARYDESIFDCAAGVGVESRYYRGEPTREFRVLDPSEIHAFMDYVPVYWRPRLWTPAMTGCRLAEFLAINWRERAPADESIRLPEVVTRGGKLAAGLKTTHHIADVAERSTETLFNSALAAMYQQHPLPFDGYLVRTPSGGFFSHRNFYRDAWGDAPSNRGRHKPGPMTLYELVGGDRFTPNDMRHSFGSWLVACGIPGWVVDLWMGHSQPGIEDAHGRSRRSSVLATTYLHEVKRWRPVANSILSTVLLEGRLPNLTIHEQTRLPLEP